ncbi:MAG: hypothetical protein JWO30_1504 [Fibrobacteres bacterium]|nr:hypothetical protein [Fibrobacterota bacterium]
MPPVKKWLCLIAVTHVCLAQARAETMVDTILAKYGYEAFKKAKEIRFTFTGKVMGVGPSHTWIWKPQSDSVTLVGKRVSYSRKNMGEKEKSIDKDFINDQYWLIFPLHLGMDKGTRIEIDTGLSVSPKKKERLRRVVVAYVQSDGYTPNDTFELYVAPDGLIKEWTYHRRSGKRGVSWTWERYAAFNGVLFSQEHNGLAHITFSDISVR